MLVLLVTSSLLAFSGCALDEAGQDKPHTATDADGNTVGFDAVPERVVALEASIAKIWTLAGGQLVGISSDYENYGIELGDKAVIGSSHKPNAESVVGLNPQLVLFNPKKASHVEVANTLKDARINCFAVEINTFDDYLYYMEQFAILTGDESAYATNATAVKSAVESVLNTPHGQGPEVLLLRAYSSGMNVIARDNFVIDMIEELGAVNMAKNESNALEELSLEYIVSKDPDFIFIVYMGSNTTAIESVVAEMLTGDAWASLTAVKEGRVFVLEQALFHYKPNEKWAQAYQDLFNLLYGEIE